VSKFATIEPVELFPKVSYYTIRFEEEDTLLDQFLDAHENSPQQEGLDIIRRFLEQMGVQYGALSRYFRPEQQAFALPPPSSILGTESPDLRLYCLRLNNRVVILFGGGVKTASTAQDCPNVGPHFRLANKLTYAIDQAIKDKDLTYDPETDDLILPPGFNLMIP
jgi:hypothetical protein